MTEIEKLKQIADTLQEMVSWVIQFDQAFRELREIREQAMLMPPFEDSASRHRNSQLTETLLSSRQNIMHRQDEVVKFLSSVGLPIEWHVFPAPAIGGQIQVYNIFDAFIAITGDVDPRPNFIHITDLLEKGKLAFRRLLQEYVENPPNPISQKLKTVPHYAAAMFSWLFPTEKQRGVLGWVLIAGLVAIILRFIFGVRLEEVGKLLAKWF